MFQGSGSIDLEQNCVKEEDDDFPDTDAETTNFAARHMERLHYRMPGETLKSHTLAFAVEKMVCE